MDTQTFVALFLFNMLIVGSIGLCLVSLLVYAPFAFVLVVMIGVAGAITGKQLRKHYRSEEMMRRLSKRY